MTHGANQKLVATLKQRATALGFDSFGITRADIGSEPGQMLNDYLARDYHASMDWMADTAARRSSPTALWSNAKSVILLGMNYGPDSNPLAQLEARETGNISVYARNRDYHDIIKGRLKDIAGLLARQSGAEVKVFVDTAPVMEKVLAEQAGLGWQGKHTVLVSREFGSWLFLGAIFTDAELPESMKGSDSCGSCRACLDICPTYAFPAPYQLDAGKCLSYLSIEHKGPIPRQFRAPMGNRIYGCDDCLAVCPWNKFASETREAKLRARADLNAPDLADLLALDDAGFRTLFSGSPVKRIGWARFMRNVLIAIGNSGSDRFLPSLRALLSAEDPLVRGAAIWAFRRLSDEREAVALRTLHLDAESDPICRDEWVGDLTPALETEPA